MKYKVFIALFFGACAIVSALLLHFGYTCPEYWDNPKWVLTVCKIIGYTGLPFFSVIAANEFTTKEEEEK